MNENNYNKKILVILGHPNIDSFCGELFKKYINGAKKANATVKTISVSKLKFDPILWKGYSEIQPLEKDLVNAQKLIKWAEHVVIIYPIWWHSVPALFKGFIDRVFLPGFAFKYINGIPRGFLKGKTARLIVTSGGPWFYYKIFGNISVKMIKNGLLKFCGFNKVKTTLFGSMTNLSKKKANKHLKKVFLFGKNKK
ncbi:MAG: NAD(P)H-dependent oxidoreductase [Candidatus Woesearchaeota archaeon]